MPRVSTQVAFFGTAVATASAAHLRSSQSPIDLAGSGMSSQVRAEMAMAEHAAYITQVHEKMKDQNFPWGPKDQSEDEHSRNICIDGKQVPDFYVLGVQKCATTTLSENLMAAGMSHVHGDLNPKEFHWFDHRMDYTIGGMDGFEANKKEWLSWMPKCEATKRNTMADFTPDYFRIVPRPEGFEYTSPTDWMKSQEMDILAPQKMINLYGEEEAKKLRFALMFREPLSQMQSAWYHAASFNFTNACSSCRAESFRAALKANIKAMKKSPPQLTPWQWTTMYARQLKPWLEHFDAHQFYIIPMYQLTGEHKDQICKDLRTRLRFSAQCDSRGVPSPQSWSHEHPSVDEDAGSYRQAFDELMESENKELAAMLAKAHSEGMGLANYNGETGDKHQIYKWLTQNW